LARLRFVVARVNSATVAPSAHDQFAESPGLSCATCGYDLRSQPAEGICPECATPVAESMRVAALPDRPEWSRSDKRWRWRVVAGLWVLALLIPLPTVLTAVLPPPEPFGPYTFTDAFRYWYLESYAPMIWAPVVFCMGLVLIFSRERGTRPRRLDRVRRWGRTGSWLLLPVTLLAVSGITLLVISGIRNQINQPLGDPAFAAFARRFAMTWSEWGFIAMQWLSSGLVVLMGLVLRDALIRCGSQGLARLMVAVGLPLVALPAVVAVFYAAGAAWAEDILQWEPFFQPHLLAQGAVDWYYRGFGLTDRPSPHGYYEQIASLPAAADVRGWVSYALGFPLELIKFLLLLAIAVQLTFARRHA
jgi:hypothetical protein